MLSEELAQIVESVWETTVGNSIRRLPPTEEAASGGAHMVTASICFKGGWSGLLAATCSAALARTIAARMFHIAAEDSSPEDMHDAVAEVVNIVGGNIKAVLPTPCRLSLPAVFEGDAEGSALLVPESETVDTVCFDCEGERLTLRLVYDRWPRNSHPPSA